LTEGAGAYVSVALTSLTSPYTPHALALLRARRERPGGRCAAEQRDELAAATHPITSSAWDEAGRHFGRAAEQVQTRAAAISEAWSAEFLSRDVQHQPLTLSLARRDRWVLFRSHKRYYGFIVGLVLS